MRKQINPLFEGTLLDVNHTVSIVEMCEMCRLSNERLIEMVEYGVVEPLKPGGSVSNWQFSSQSLLRLKTAMRLQNDLDVNLAGAVLALDLLDEVKSLRQTVALLQRG